MTRVAAGVRQDAGARIHVRIPNPEAVAAAVGISPDDSWGAGDVLRSGARPATVGAWRLVEDELGVPEGSDYAAAVERCLRRLLARVNPDEFRKRLSRLDPQLRPTVVLTGFAHEFPNVFIPADLVAKIAELGADIEEDFYLLPTDSADGKEAS